VAALKALLHGNCRIVRTCRLNTVSSVLTSFSYVTWDMLVSRKIMTSFMEEMATLKLILQQLTPCSRVLLETLIVIYLVNKFTAFYRIRMLSCLQDLATGPYARQDESSPQLPYTISLRSILILFSHIRLRLPSSLPFMVSRPKFCMNFSPLLWVLHVPSISSSLIWSPL
jgi:hypothetical protein